jgi:hypothetical protein
MMDVVEFGTEDVVVYQDSFMDYGEELESDFSEIDYPDTPDDSEYEDTSDDSDEDMIVDFSPL